MIAKSLFYSTAFAGVLLISACASPVDTPIPNDPQAQEWTPGIQVAYPDWQSPDGIPLENPDYADSLIAASQAAKETVPPAKLEPMEAADSPKEAEGEKTPDKTEQADVKKETAGDVLKQEEPAVQQQQVVLTPDFTRVDILLPPGQTVESYCLNGEAIRLDDLKLQLKKFAEDCGSRESTALIYVANPDAVNSQKILELIKLCQDSGITRSSVVDARDLSGITVAPLESTRQDKVAPVAKPQKFKMVVDAEKPAEEYVVVSGDSLSLIAKKKYRDGNLWGILYENNKDLIKNKNFLRPGTKIKIPVLRKVVVE